MIDELIKLDSADMSFEVASSTRKLVAVDVGLENVPFVLLMVSDGFRTAELVGLVADGCRVGCVPSPI